MLCVERVNGSPYCCETHQKRFEQIEPQHVCSVALGYSRIGVSLHEETVGTGGYCGTGYGLYQFRTSACDAAGSVGLLQRVGTVYDYRAAAGLLHTRHTAEVDHKVTVAEGGAAFGDGDIIVAASPYLIYGESHRFGREKLTFLYVYRLAGARRGNQQIGLPAQKCRYLEYVDKIGGHSRFLRLMYVGDNGYIEFASYGIEYGESLYVAYAAERIETAAVGLAVAALEGVGYIKTAADTADGVAYIICHFLAFDHTRTGDKKEV